MADCIRSYKHNEIAQACRILKYTHIYPDGEIWKDMCVHSISELLHILHYIYIIRQIHIAQYCTACLILDFLLFITICCYENMTLL